MKRWYNQFSCTNQNYDSARMRWKRNWPWKTTDIRNDDIIQFLYIRTILLNKVVLWRLVVWTYGQTGLCWIDSINKDIERLTLRTEKSTGLGKWQRTMEIIIFVLIAGKWLASIADETDAETDWIPHNAQHLSKIHLFVLKLAEPFLGTIWKMQ